MVRPGGLPPRQREPLVHRLAMPALVFVSTVVLVGLIWLFARGTSPEARRIQPADQKAQATKTAMMDGWHRGLPSEPASNGTPPPPPKPVDEEARRDIRLLRETVMTQNQQITKALEEIRAQMAKQQTATQEKTPPRQPPPKIQVPKPDSLVLYAYQPSAQDIPQGTGLTAGTVINVSLKTRVNSERQTVIVAEVREHIKDSRHPDLILMPQFSKVILGTDPKQIIAGEERVDIALDRIELPNRRTIELPKVPVVDQIGQGGLTGAIDRKWRYVIPALLARGVFAASVSQVTTVGVPALNGLQADGRQIGQTVTEPYINVRPTIIIPEGERAAVILTKDLPLPVYHF